jgi:hypothetical protein
MAAAPTLDPVLAAVVGALAAAALDVADADAAADAVDCMELLTELLLWQPVRTIPAAASAKGTERRRREFIMDPSLFTSYVRS